jgi:hypothetical protein
MRTTSEERRIERSAGSEAGRAKEESEILASFTRRVRFN